MNMPNNNLIEQNINNVSKFVEISEIESINSTYYKFNSHTFKVCIPVNYDIECKKCTQYIFQKNRDLALLNCNHLCHEECVREMFFVGVDCQYNKCNLNSAIMEEYQNYNSFKDNIILNCVEEHDNNKCYLSIKYADLQKYNDTNPTELLQSILSNTLKYFNERYKHAVKNNIFSQLNKLGMISADSKDSICDATKSLMNSIIKTQEIPQKSFAEFVNVVENAELSCPYPITKFTSDPAQGFLSRNKQFIIDFLTEELKPNHSYDFMGNHISDLVHAVGNTIQIKIDEVLLAGRRYQEYTKILPYTAERIETGITGADAFNKLMLIFNTDLTLLNFIKKTKIKYVHTEKKLVLYENKQAFHKGTSAYFSEWCGIKDYIKIYANSKEYTFKLSSFLNADQRTLDLSVLNKQLEAIKISLKFLCSNL